jgi:hypothetical protein
MSPFIEIIDKYGRRRRARRGEVPADGETIHVPTILMDAAARAARDALAQKYGWHDQQPRGGFRRGYAFADTTPPRKVQDAAAEAYEAKRAYLQNAWRKNHQNATEDDDPLPTRDARADADQAWLDKKERLQNGWRMK